MGNCKILFCYMNPWIENKLKNIQKINLHIFCIFLLTLIVLCIIMILVNAKKPCKGKYNYRTFKNANL